MIVPQEMRLMGVHLIGVHPYTFRCGKPALITGVKTFSTSELTARICYEITFPDGFIDYVPLCDMQNYRMELIP